MTDYTFVTEAAGCRITREQLQRMHTRYVFAAELCRGKDVLEAGCGAGQGLGILAREARCVVAGDYTENLVRMAREHYGSRIDIRQFDAQQMPFEDRSFDAVILYEAIYYLPQPEQFLDECRRVLRPDGVVLICTANKDWSGFARSPESHRYFSTPELHELLKSRGFEPALYGDCPVWDASVRGWVTSGIRFAVAKLGLMPKSMRMKERFKRIFFGKLVDMPAELSVKGNEYARPVPIDPTLPNRDFKVVFAVGTLRP